MEIVKIIVQWWFNIVFLCGLTYLTWEGIVFVYRKFKPVERMFISSWAFYDDGELNIASYKHYFDKPVGVETVESIQKRISESKDVEYERIVLIGFTEIK